MIERVSVSCSLCGVILYPKIHGKWKNRQAQRPHTLNLTFSLGDEQGLFFLHGSS